MVCLSYGAMYTTLSPVAVRMVSIKETSIAPCRYPSVQFLFRMRGGHDIQVRAFLYFAIPNSGHPCKD